MTLSTFEWQARGFYLKQGYEEFGHIDNYIQGFQLVYLKKALTSSDPEDLGGKTP
ncbi:hypothetical protein D3C86_2202840 [compost metagenome]